MAEVRVAGQRVVLGRSIGKGGEGEVFALQGREAEALKLYKPELRASRERKVRAMVEGGLARSTNLVAFPASVATDASNRFIGFVMRLVSGYRPIHQLYSPKSRQVHFASADYRSVVRTALNVANAVGKVHESGCVIGDLNHSGILVADNATVSLIDADSFQFSHAGQTYPCLVGVPEFTPPELQDRNLSQVTRTRAHDEFGLAVAIFLLLFMGRHPYAGVYRGADLSMGEAIKQNRFAFSMRRQAETQTTPPPGSPTLGMYPSRVQEAFERAFGTDPARRPSAAEWAAVLKEMEATLVRCRDTASHYYPRSVGSCLWCGLARVTGFDMFPPDYSSAPARQIDTVGLERLIRQLESVRLPALESLVPAPRRPKARSAAFSQAKAAYDSRRFMGAAVGVGSIAAIFAVPDLILLCLMGAGAGWFAFATANFDTKRWQKNYNQARARLDAELSSFLQRQGVQQAYAAADAREELIKAYRAVDRQLADELVRLKATRRDRQLTAYLDRFHIRDADIYGVGPSKTATLASFGIETAADVTHAAVINVPGFGPVKARAMVEWRERHEQRFSYTTAPTPQDKRDEAQLRSKFAVYRSKIDGELREIANVLSRAQPALRALATRAASDERLRKAGADLAAASNDLVGAGGRPGGFVASRPRPRALGMSPPKADVPKASALARSTTVGGAAAGFGQRSKSRRTTGSNSKPDCPRCSKPMVRRRGPRGSFWGCVQFPRCRGTRNI